jgi:ribosomal protein S10
MRKFLRFENLKLAGKLTEPRMTENVGVSAKGNLTARLTVTSCQNDQIHTVGTFVKCCLSLAKIPSTPLISTQNITKFHTIKGPFVHAKSKQVFEKVKYSRAIQILDTDLQVVDEFVKYIKQKLPHSCDLKVEKFDFKAIDDLVGQEPQGLDQLTFTQKVMDAKEAYLKQFSQ